MLFFIVLAEIVPGVPETAEVKDRSFSSEALIPKIVDFPTLNWSQSLNGNSAFSLINKFRKLLTANVFISFISIHYLLQFTIHVYLSLKTDNRGFG